MEVPGAVNCSPAVILCLAAGFLHPQAREQRLELPYGPKRGFQSRN